jgi:glycosyltransferase involved in cell wall biosynthesis
VYNELPYLPTVIKFWEAQGVDCYIIDNFSNDGTWEWLQEHKIKSHRFSTNDSFDLVALLQEITKTIHEVKPDWVIYGAADMYYWYGAPIKEVIKTAIEKGCDVITGNSYSAKLVTEFVSSDWFENVHFEVGKRKWRMVAKYVPELELNIDAIDVPNPCVFKTNGILLNYGAVKPIAEQEIRFKRRKKAWEQGLSKELGVHYAKNHEQNYIFDSKALVDIRSTTAYKDFQQVKALCSTRAKTTKVGIVIPTCSKERKLFVDFLESRLQKQTVKPDVIAKIDYPNTTTKPDLAKRYREGAKKCFDAGCDFVLFIEDDDYYPLTYIEEMTKAWEDAERPCLIGHDETIYYHILSKGYKYHSTTLKHTSAFCTGITKKVAMGAKVCADTNAFIDIALWNRNKGVQVHLEHPPIGIKHGIGKTGGAFHDDKRYKLYDSNCSLLKTLVDEEAFEFYTNLEYI